MRFLRDVLKSESGAALLEAILVMPILLLILCLVFDFAQMYLDYGTADKSLRDAVRYLATVPKDYVCSWGKDNAIQMATAYDASMTGVSAYTVTLVSPDCSGAVSTPTEITLKGQMSYRGILVPFGSSGTMTLQVQDNEPFTGS